MEAKINLLERNIVKMKEREDEGILMANMEEEKLKNIILELEDKLYKTEIDLRWIVWTMSAIVDSKKYKKQEIKERLKSLIKNVGIF